MTARFFRAREDVYEAARARLDAACGYPDAQLKTLTAITPASQQPRDANGMVLLAVDATICDRGAQAVVLRRLLIDRLVEELTEAEYAAACGVRSP